MVIALGLCSVSKKSVETILTKGPGHSCTIVVGGASEALYAFPGTANLVLKRRMGFIKMAIKTGAHLVPIFAFGENGTLNDPF
jgi:2-acylglycerol O-acyltransferase 2